jgi:hypothetical protein
MTALDGTTWGIADAAALVAGIDRELAVRETAFPELVTKGRVRQEEADWNLGVIRDMRADLLFAFASVEGEIRGSWDRPDNSVTWADKVRWIERELEDARRRFPELVAKGRIDAADAQRRTSTLEHLRRLYWNRMFQWRPPEGPGLDYLRSLEALGHAGARVKPGSEGQRIYREHVRAHLALVDQESADAQGRLVA